MFMENPMQNKNYSLKTGVTRAICPTFQLEKGERLK